MIRNILLSATAAALLGGCAQNNVVPAPVVATAVQENAPVAPTRFQSSYVGGKVQDNWLKSFKDPTLNRLIKEGQRNNPDLRVAASRVERAIAMLNLTNTARMPRLDVSGGYEYTNWEAANRHDRGDIVLALSWEPDLWGRVANAVASDAEMTVATMADFEWARQSLSAQTARAWFLLGSDKMIYDFQKQVLNIQRKAERILTQQANIGSGNMRDVHMMRGMVAEARDNVQAALSTKERDARALEILIGRYPANALKAKNLRAVTGKVPSGVPLELLNRRADIIAAQYRVASAFHNVQSMALLKLPRITLGGELGADVVQGSVSKFLSGIFMPVFDAGRIQSLIDAASADQKAALANYQSVVFNAYREVEDALAQEKHLKYRERYLTTMVKEFKTAYNMTNENYKIGQGTILDVLNAQSKWINARILQTQVRKERLVNRVNLHLALGGSFDRPPVVEVVEVKK